MAHTGIFASAAEIGLQVGELVDSTGYTETLINFSCLHAESFINVLCKYNFSDKYATLNADVKGILAEAEACWVAIDFIKYNMAGYTSRQEAETNINICWAKFWALMAVLQEQDHISYMLVA
jgi:hypothetical protein